MNESKTAEIPSLIGISLFGENRFQLGSRGLGADLRNFYLFFFNFFRMKYFFSLCALGCMMGRAVGQEPIKIEIDPIDHTLDSLWRIEHLLETDKHEEGLSLLQPLLKNIRDYDAWTGEELVAPKQRHREQADCVPEKQTIIREEHRRFYYANGGIPLADYTNNQWDGLSSLHFKQKPILKKNYYPRHESLTLKLAIHLYAALHDTARAVYAAAKLVNCELAGLQREMDLSDITVSEWKQSYLLETYPTLLKYSYLHPYAADLLLNTKSFILYNRQLFREYMAFHCTDERVCLVYDEWLESNQKVLKGEVNDTLDIQNRACEELLFYYFKQFETDPANFTPKDLRDRYYQLPMLRFRSAILTQQDLRDQLSPQEVAIDFFHYPIIDPLRAIPIDTLYCAFLTHLRHPEPILIELARQSELRRYIDVPILFDGNILNYQHYINHSGHSHALYQLIWAKIEPHLRGVRAVHLSLSGILSNVPIHALIARPDSRKPFVLQRPYVIHYHNSLRDFILKKDSKNRLRSMAFLGDFKYGLDSLQLAQSRFRGGPVGQLNAAADEKQQLTHYSKLAGIDCTILDGSEGTEDNILALLQRKNFDLLHFTTHGFRTPDSLPVSPLDAVGICVAGYNNYLQDPDSSGLRDGVLTGGEWLCLDLHQTQLVVLSACRTGLGPIDAAEGVLGLPRVLKMAGARQVLATLWDVNDEQTSLFMRYFYRKYIVQRTTAYRALRAAQHRMLNHKQIRSQTSDWSAYLWGGFLLLE